MDGFRGLADPGATSLAEVSARQRMGDDTGAAVAILGAVPLPGLAGLGDEIADGTRILNEGDDLVDVALVSRVQGGILPRASQHRIALTADGGIDVIGDKTLWVTVDDMGRSRAFLDANRPGGEIVSFQVSADFAKEIRAAAVVEDGARGAGSAPIMGDVTRTDCSFGLRGDWIQRLEEEMIKGSGKLE